MNEDQESLFTRVQGGTKLRLYAHGSGKDFKTNMEGKHSMPRTPNLGGRWERRSGSSSLS